MSYTFVNRPEVRADIINATDYYKNINSELANAHESPDSKQNLLYLHYHRRKRKDQNQIIKH